MFGKSLNQQYMMTLGIPFLRRLGCILLLLWTSAYSQQRTDPSPQAKAAQLVESFMRQKSIPGLSVAVTHKNQLLWSRGFGFADLENRVQMWPNTMMRIASISKPITAVALGLLWESGDLDWDAPVRKYVPAFPEKKWPFTVRQLASHQAGIRTYRGNEYYSKKYYRNTMESLVIFKNDSLQFKPGTKFLYSTYGYTLLGAVIQGASGQDYRAFVRQRVFDPLKMYNTQAEDRGVANYVTSRFYTKDKRTGRILGAKWVDNSNKWAGGGFLSTAEDVAHFGGGLLTGRLLKKETLELLFTPIPTQSGKVTNYGLGWAAETRNGKRFIGHSGSPVGGSAVLVLLPEKQLAIAILCNLQAVELRYLAYDLSALFEAQLK